MTSDEFATFALTEQASLTSGANAWTTQAVRDVVRALRVSDGPHGVRRVLTDDLFADVLPATCFPPAVTLGSSWDTGLAHRVGVALAREAEAFGVDVLLGPGLNIKRSPLCGRNFEYFSEDPHLTGVLGAALVSGIQSQGIGACIKHFAVNNQETDRMRVSADVDEQTLRELYLPAFEHIVREARPYAVMAAYNRINGVYATQNRWLLTEVLREEWGFDGLVMSDWGAVDDRVAALAAGLDLEMPPSGTDEQIVAAVQDGRLDPRAVAAAAGRLLRLRDRLNRADRAGGLDENTHHELAREAARAGAVLLKNDGDLLPIDPAAQQRVAVIGEFARTPRYQGHGSSRVEPTRVDDAWTALRQGAGPDLELVFAPGFLLDGSPSAALLDEAVEAATAADLVLVFLGLPEGAETEGKDRADIELPPAQIELLRAVGAACSQVVVVLSNGGVVALTDWQDHAQAVLETWLGGQAGGSAVVDLLYGVHSPSGKLTESIPLRLQDVPSYLHYPGRDGHSVYGEGRYVGYRYYDTLNLPVAYPFGHGLSYTTFDYRDLRVEETGDHSWTVRASIVNTGSRFGEEVVQLYVAFAEPYPTRPHHELRGFTKIGLAPGDSGQVEFRLTGRDLAWYSTKRRGWRIDPGTFTVELGASSRDIRLWARLHTPGDGVRDKPTPESTLSEWLDHPTGGKLLREHLAARPGAVSLGDLDQVTLDAVSQIPLTKFHSTLGLSTEAMDALVAAVRES